MNPADLRPVLRATPIGRVAVGVATRATGT